MSLKPLIKKLKVAAESERTNAKFLFFTIHNQKFATDVTKIIEITGKLPVIETPQKKSFIKGVINVRGHIITVADLALKLGFKETDLSSPEINFIIFGENKLPLAAVPVDRVDFTLREGLILDRSEGLTSDQCPKLCDKLAKAVIPGNAPEELPLLEPLLLLEPDDRELIKEIIDSYNV